MVLVSGAGKCFEETKEQLVSLQVLVHLDPDVDIHLACDTSDYGIGAV